MAGFGDGLGFVDDKARDRHRFIIGQIPIHGAVEIADRHHAIDIDAAIGLGAHALHGDIVLVLNIADDFLENILERDEPHQRAIFIDHEREMLPPAQEFGELILGHGGVGREPGGAHDVAHVEAVAAMFGDGA